MRASLMTPESLARWGRWVRWGMPVLARSFRRLAVKRLADGRLNSAVIPHLIGALESPDAFVRQTASEALGGLGGSPASVDALCVVWAVGRDARLGRLIAERGYQASSPVELRVFSGLQAGRLEELARAGAEAMLPLVAALGEKDPALAERARRTLETFVSADALVDCALNHAEGAVLAPIIDGRPIRHSIEGRWFLYLALAGRFDDYLAADFEFQTLRAEFRAAPPPLQARIRESIVRAGDTRMNPLFVGEKRRVVLADLSDQEADLLVSVNVRNQNFHELFKFLWVLPARHIRDSIAAMSKAGWRPEDGDREALFDQLAALVGTGGKTPKPAMAPALLNPVLQQWLARGDKEWSWEPMEKLRERLKDKIPPPDQIAALGALRARGKLTAELLDLAGRSQHWLVRLTVAGLGGSAQPVNDGGKEWIERIQTASGQEWLARMQTALGAQSVWGLKPCHVTRGGLEALQDGLACLPDRRVAGGLNLIEAMAAHFTAHDIEIELGARALVGEDSFEIGE
jgi:hypothetical protein